MWVVSWNSKIPQKTPRRRPFIRRERVTSCGGGYWRRSTGAVVVSRAQGTPGTQLAAFAPRTATWSSVQMGSRALRSRLCRVRYAFPAERLYFFPVLFFSAAGVLCKTQFLLGERQNGPISAVDFSTGGRHPF